MLTGNVKLPTSLSLATSYLKKKTREMYSTFIQACNWNAWNLLSPVFVSSLNQFLPMLHSARYIFKRPAYNTASLELKYSFFLSLGLCFCEGPSSHPGPCVMFSLTYAVIRRLNLEVLHWGLNWGKMAEWTAHSGDFMRILLSTKAACISILIVTMI